MADDYKYYQAVPGAVVARYGQRTYIGVRRGLDGYEWTDRIVRIPQMEFIRYQREYRRAVMAGSLIEMSKKKYDAQERKIAAAEEKLAAANKEG